MLKDVLLEMFNGMTFQEFDAQLDEALIHFEKTNKINSYEFHRFKRLRMDKKETPPEFNPFTKTGDFEKFCDYKFLIAMNGLNIILFRQKPTMLSIDLYYFYFYNKYENKMTNEQKLQFKGIKDEIVDYLQKGNVIENVGDFFLVNDKKEYYLHTVPDKLKPDHCRISNSECVQFLIDELKFNEMICDL